MCERCRKMEMNKTNKNSRKQNCRITDKIGIECVLCSFSMFVFVCERFIFVDFLFSLEHPLYNEITRA